MHFLFLYFWVMKKIVVFLCGLFISLFAAAQSTQWVDAQNLFVGGHGPWASHDAYERLPAELKGTVRDALWNLGTNSSGLYVRFSTDSPTVSARWALKGNNAMDHMTSVGIKGVDLYWRNPKTKQWQYVQTGRPYALENTRTLAKNMTPERREFMLYLPLYEGVSKVEIGVDSASTIEGPQLDSPQTKDNRPIVFYGTSILQGACASRPGMCHTSILSRRLDRASINLGFSGNGKLDYELAETLARVENPFAYVLDFVTNCSPELVESNMAKFIGIIREKHPKTPIVVVEQTWFPPAELDTKAAEERDAKNEVLRRVYKQIKASGDRNIYYTGGKELMGSDFESWVDGLHGTDLGFMRYADMLYPLLRWLGAR